MKARLEPVLLPLIVAVLFVAGWHLAVRESGTDIFPTPKMVVLGTLELARRGVLLKYVVASLFRVTSGYLLAVFLGIPLGLLMGWFGRARLALNPAIQVLRPISPGGRRSGGRPRSEAHLHLPGERRLPLDERRGERRLRREAVHRVRAPRAGPPLRRHGRPGRLADRIVVLGRRPSRIRAVLPVDAPRPRDLDDPACRLLRDEVFDIMGLDHHGQRI